MRTRGLPRRSRAKAGQALMELAVGMFTLALLLSALFAFTHYIARSLEIQNHLRSSGWATYADKIELDDFAAKKVFGSSVLHIMEPRGATDRTIQ